MARVGGVLWCFRPRNVFDLRILSLDEVLTFNRSSIGCRIQLAVESFIRGPSIWPFSISSRYSVQVSVVVPFMSEVILDSVLCV